MLNIIWAIIAGLIIGLGIVGDLIGNWLAALFGVRFTGGVDWIRHILQVGAAAVLIAVIAPVWVRRGADRGV